MTWLISRTEFSSTELVLEINHVTNVTKVLNETTASDRVSRFAQSYLFYQRNRSIVHGGERDTISEAVVSIRTLVTFVTWLISRTEFSSSELVL